MGKEYEIIRWIGEKKGFVLRNKLIKINTIILPKKII